MKIEADHGRGLSKIIGIFWHWPEDIEDFDRWCQDAPWCGVFAVVKDGQWYEQGRMGWWAIVTDEKNEEVWQDELNKLVLELDRDKWITVVDCHI